jgi:hypothetical protein
MMKKLEMLVTFLLACASLQTRPLKGISIRSIAIISFSLILTWLPSEAVGVIIRDEYWPANSDGVWQISSEFIGQVIQSHVDGQLVRIELPMGSYNPADDLFWQIIPATPNSPNPGNALLAEGLIPKTNIDLIGPINIDLAGFQLNFQVGDYFALTLYSPSPWRSWYSYRGYDAPNLTFQKYAGFWNKLDNTIGYPPNQPHYSPGFSTFFEVVPEPDANLLLFVALAIFPVICRHANHSLPHSMERNKKG